MSRILSDCTTAYSRDQRCNSCVDNKGRPPVYRVDDKETILPPDDRDYIHMPAASRDEIWFEDPSVIYKNDNWKIFFPNKNMTKIEVLNSIYRFSLYLFVILAIWSHSIDSIVIPIVTGLLTLFIHSTTDPSERFRECFDDTRTSPTEHNPFMNTLLTDVGNGERPEAADINNPYIKKEMEYLFNKNLYKDVTDIYNKTNSQGRFHTVPSTKEFGIKSGDTVKFANWLYNNPRPTCKEDTLYCPTSDAAFGFDSWTTTKAHRFLGVPNDWPDPLVGRNT